MTSTKKIVGLVLFLGGLGWSTAFAASADPTKISGDGPLLGSGLMDVLAHGGPVMWVMLGMSVIGCAFAFERLVALRIHVLVPARFVSQLREALGRSDYDEIDKLVGSQKGPLARMLAAGLKRQIFGSRDMERAMEAHGAKEIAKLKRPVQPLSVLAHVEPLLGLLGTILGMISTFNILHTTSTANRVETLAPGIGQALYTTAAGLCIAIPFVILYHYLMGKVHRIAEEWSEVGSELVFTYGYEDKKAAEAA